MIKNISVWLGANWLTLVAVGLVVGALYNSNLPFAYFQVMNWAVVGAAILIALRVHIAPIMWTFIAVAVLFNPISPIFLRVDIWQIADVIVIFFFILSLFISAKK